MAISSVVASKQFMLGNMKAHILTYIKDGVGTTDTINCAASTGLPTGSLYPQFRQVKAMFMNVTTGLFSRLHYTTPTSGGDTEELATLVVTHTAATTRLVTILILGY